MDWSKRIGRRIRVQDLHILSAVVEFRSLARAAEYLAVSRPVVSRAIADLETEVGVRLLDRDRHGAVPTIYGSTLLKRGAVVFDELRQSLNDIEISQRSEGWGGTDRMSQFSGYRLRDGRN